MLGVFLYFVGEQGKQGKTGAQGPRGAKGEKGQDGAGTSGVKYVRWGRTTCPSGAQIVYKGMRKEAYTIVTIMP